MNSLFYNIILSVNFNHKSVLICVICETLFEFHFEPILELISY